MWQPSLRYPDPSIETLDDSFNALKLTLASVERLATGFRWCEGAVYFGDARHLLWSDIPNNAIMKWDEDTGAVSTYRKPANFSNGHTRDKQGRLISCEHGGRRVTRTEYDGSITVLIDNFEGTPLNSPNDVVVKSDGTVWFTDPAFGILSDYEGYKATPELPLNVYCYNPATNKAHVVAEMRAPNGLAFSPDESILYVVECRATPVKLILAYDVEGHSLKNKRTIINCGKGDPDGFRVDIHGNLWCSWGTGTGLDGVRVFNAKGKAIGHIHLPERSANLCFGGVKKNRLFMAASHSLYALYVNTQGL